MSSKEVRALPSRTVGHSQVYLLLILVLGFLLIFSYQSEIYTVLGGTDGISHVHQRNSTIPQRNPIIKSSESHATFETESTRSTHGKDVLKASKENAGQTPRKIDSNQSLLQPATSSSKRKPVRNKNDNRWKDVKVEAYKPLVNSVHSNILSSKFELVIKVLALNNYGSLSRCLNSLSAAEYAGDSVDVHIYIDHFEISEAAESRKRLLAEEELGTGVKSGHDDGVGNVKRDDTERIQRKKSRKKQKKDSNASPESDGRDVLEEVRVPDRLESMSAVKQGDWGLVEDRLRDARRVLWFAESFQWKHGRKVIHYRTRTAGSQSQWLDAWWPASDNQFALFVEDDAELSPLYYRYVRSLIATYYYQPGHFDPSLYGISLQRPQIVPGKNGQPLKVDERTRLFKYQMVGIWGQIFFPRPWKEFRAWYDTKKSHDSKPIIDGMVTTDWYKVFGEKMFTPWFVKFAYNQGYYNLYTNFLKDRVLSVTHRHKGVKTKKYAGCDSVLIWGNGTYDLDIWHMAANWDIKRYDYCFREVRVGRFANYSRDLSWVARSAQQNNTILIVSIIGVPEYLVRNWLCNLKKFGSQNYLLVGEDPGMLEDLARRGHPTMRFENMGELEEYFEKEVNVVSQILALGYDVWFTRADSIWVGNPLALVDIGRADVIGVENSELNLFFIRRTETTARLWGIFDRALPNVLVNVSRTTNWERARDKFLKACEEEQVPVNGLQQIVFTDGSQLEQPLTLDSGGVSADAQVLVFSGLRSSAKIEIKRKMSQLNLWNLDGDLACSTLIC